MLYFHAHKFIRAQTSMVDYLNAVSAVSAYAAAITATNLPVMTNAPGWYADFNTGWTAVKADAGEWTGGIAPNLMSTLAINRDDNQLVSDDLTNALTQINTLATDPNNQEAKKLLADILTLINGTVGGTPAAVAALQQQLVANRAALQNDAGKIATAISNAANQVGVDNAQVQQLLSDIGSLQNDIAAYNQVINTADIASKAGIAIGVVGIFVGLYSPVLGGAVITVGVVMIGGSYIAKIVLDKKIADANATILSDRGQITDLNAQVATLTQLQKNLNTLIKLSATADAAFGTINSFWAEFAADFQAFSAALTSTEADVGAARYAAAQADIKFCIDGWQAFQTFIAPIADLSVTINNQPTMITANAA